MMVYPGYPLVRVGARFFGQVLLESISHVAGPAMLIVDFGASKKVGARAAGRLQHCLSNLLVLSKEEV